MQQVRIKFPNAYIQINGISPQTYSEQTKFLDFADAENVESFGITEQNDSIFLSAVLPYIKMMDSITVINKRFNLFGAGHGSYKNSTEYRFYDDEKKWEKYLFGCFLLGTNENSGFHFRTGSAFPTRDTGRFCDLDLHTDYIYNRLGNSINHYNKETNGLYTRSFQNGFVVVAPVTNTPLTYNYNLNNTCYDNEGNAFSNSISLQSGQAYILYNSKQPDLPCKYEINFEDSTNTGNYIAMGLRDEPNINIKTETNGNHYASFTKIKPASGYDIFEHDVMLDWVRYQHKDSLFTFNYRTTNSKAVIQVFCEVDDTLTHKYYNAILNFSSTAPKLKKFDFGYEYRTLVFPWNQPQKIPNVQSSSLLISDGNWHTITINGSELLSAGVKFIRPHYMRVKGTIDLDDIIVYHSTCSSNFYFAKK